MDYITHIHHKIIPLLKTHYIFLAIFVLVLFLRLYRMEFLTTYGRDQGIDFLTVREMLINHKFTLIGIKTSIGDFFQGPNYLYILLPFFWLFNLKPIAGAYAALTISLLTILVLYATASHFFTKRVAIVSSLLFAVSPEFIKEGNSPLYQHFVPLFILLGFYLLLSYHQKTSLWKIAVLGFVAGFAMELHFLAITFALAAPLYFLFFQRSKVKVLSFYLLGLVGGLLPTIVFEVRHSFLNVKLFLNYVQTGNNQTNLLNSFSTWATGASKVLGANFPLLGKLILLILFWALVKKYQQKNIQIIQRLIIIQIVILIVFTLFLHSFEAHYLLPVWVFSLLLLPILFEQLQSPLKNFIFLLALLNLFSSITMLNNNHGYTMPPGWNLTQIEKTAQIINSEGQGLTEVNVASLLDGDTRSYPLRYSLSYRNFKLNGVEDYPNDSVLYVVASSNSNQVLSSKVWEITTLSPFLLTKKWDLGNNISLYRLNKSL